MNTPERAGQGPLIELANGQQWAMPPMPPSRARGSQSSGENRRYHHDPGVRQLTPGGFGSGPVEGLTTLPALLRHIRESLHWAPKRDVTVAVLVVPWETHGPTDIDPRSGDGVSRFHSQLREGDVVAQVAPGIMAACTIVGTEQDGESLRRRLARSAVGSEPGGNAAASVGLATARFPVTRPEDLLRIALSQLDPVYVERSMRASGQSALAAPAAQGAGAGVGPKLSHMAIRGGGYLVAREAIGMVIRLAGIVLTVRAIGPAGYGIYSGAAAFVMVVTTIAQMGAEIYLMRQPRQLTRHDYDVAFTFLLVTSLACMAVALGLTFFIGGLLRPTGVLLPVRILLLSIPINVLWAPAQAAIERQFRYRRMGLIELGGDVALYGTAVPLAFLHFGAWSLVAGFFAWQSWLLVSAYALSGIRPRLRWSGAMAKELFHHGFTFSLSSWIIRLGGLVNPLVVGSFFGAVGVGYVAFAQRLVDTVGFAQRGAYRLGMVAMAKVPSDQKVRLRYAIEEGSTLQLIALAVPFAGFGFVAHWMIPLLFGHEWSRAVPLYVLLSVALIINASGIIQMTFLLSRGRNMAVAGAALIQGIVLAAASVVLVRAWGVNGFGAATILGMVWLVYMDRVVREIVEFSYRRVLPFAVILVPLLVTPVIAFPWSLLAAAPAVAAMLVPRLRTEPLRLLSVVRSSVRPQTST